ncbi:MAG: DUF3006 domain-containing protein [Chloroflexota bacterium]
MKEANTMQQAIVDRFEGKTAVLLIEDKPLDVLRSNLPPGTHEGDYLQIEVHEGKLISVERDDGATETAKQRIEDKLAHLRRRDHLSNDT